MTRCQPSAVSAKTELNIERKYLKPAFYNLPSPVYTLLSEVKKEAIMNNNDCLSTDAESRFTRKKSEVQTR